MKSDNDMSEADQGFDQGTILRVRQDIKSEPVKCQGVELESCIKSLIRLLNQPVILFSFPHRGINSFTHLLRDWWMSQL